MSLPNYLRALRNREGLTQAELARLLCLARQGSIARLELDGKTPSNRILIASEIVFGCPACEIFPVAYCDTKIEVMREATALYERLEQRKDLGAAAKLAFLTALIRRLESNPDL